MHRELLVPEAALHASSFNSHTAVPWHGGNYVLGSDHRQDNVNRALESVDTEVRNHTPELDGKLGPVGTGRGRGLHISKTPACPSFHRSQELKFAKVAAWNDVEHKWSTTEF
jgi:hypothetical protein